jgi:hypothetical protein
VAPDTGVNATANHARVADQDYTRLTKLDEIRQELWFFISVLSWLFSLLDPHFSCIIPAL